MPKPDILEFNHQSRLLFGAKESPTGTVACPVKLSIHNDGLHYGYGANGSTSSQAKAKVTIEFLKSKGIPHEINHGTAKADSFDPKTLEPTGPVEYNIISSVAVPKEHTRTLIALNTEHALERNKTDLQPNIGEPTL